MRLSTSLVVDSLRDVADPAKRIEEMGFETLYISERKRNPFLQLAVAAVSTSRIRLGPEVAPAFPRNPMVLAYTAWDLQKYGDMLDEVLIYFGEPEKGDPSVWKRLIAAFREHDRR